MSTSSSRPTTPTRDLIGYVLVVVIPVAVMLALSVKLWAVIVVGLFLLVLYPYRVWRRRHKRGS